MSTTFPTTEWSQRFNNAQRCAHTLPSAVAYSLTWFYIYSSNCHIRQIFGFALQWFEQLSVAVLHPVHPHIASPGKISGTRSGYTDLRGYSCTQAVVRTCSFVRGVPISAALYEKFTNDKIMCGRHRVSPTTLFAVRSVPVGQNSVAGERSQARHDRTRRWCMHMCTCVCAPRPANCHYTGVSPCAELAWGLPVARSLHADAIVARLAHPAAMIPATAKLIIFPSLKRCVGVGVGRASKRVASSSSEEGNLDLHKSAGCCRVS